MSKNRPSNPQGPNVIGANAPDLFKQNSLTIRLPGSNPALSETRQTVGDTKASRVVSAAVSKSGKPDCQPSRRLILEARFVFSDLASVLGTVRRRGLQR